MLYRFSRLALGRLAVFVFPCLIAAPLAALAADEFPVSAAQMQSLGVQVQRLEKSGDSSGQAYSARVVLAPGQEQVVSAPLAGVVDQLLVAENDAVKAGQPLMRLISPELGELQLKLMEVNSSSRLSQKALQRERQLFSEGIIPERRVQEAEATAAQDAARKRQAWAARTASGHAFAHRQYQQAGVGNPDSIGPQCPGDNGEGRPDHCDGANRSARRGAQREPYGQRQTGTDPEGGDHQGI